MLGWPQSSLLCYSSYLLVGESGVLGGSDEAFTVISSVHVDRCVTVTVKGLTISDLIGDITLRMA